jgi:hypothetical protein
VATALNYADMEECIAGTVGQLDEAEAFVRVVPLDSSSNLGRGAAGIDASAADEMALNDSHLHPGAGQAECQRWSGLAGADDDRVEVGHDKPRRGRQLARLQ